MQTFLPYRSFHKTAKCLDYRRLGKQRVEAKQILMILLGETLTKAWKNHPAVLMWRGYEEALAYYGVCICEEWIHRGYNDSLLQYFLNRSKANFLYPKWIGRRAFHYAHKSNLLRKDAQYYSKYDWNIQNNLPYVWPHASI